jgi:TolB protein
MIKEEQMSVKARRIIGGTLVLSLFIQMQIAENGYAFRRTKIAFTSTRDGNIDIYVMDVDGSNQRRVTVNPANDELPAWSPDGKKIAFVSNRNNVNEDHRQIWVIDADGKNPIRLTDGLVDTYPDWSPDGTKIVYDTHLVPEGHHLAPGGITVMDADGKDKKLVKNARGLHPTWSPDGKRIAFISTVDVINHLFVMDADGRNRMQLTHDFVRKRLPSWSHDGKRIAYVGDNVIWVVDSDGENPRQLTWHVATEEHPTWSPDSESIAFTSFLRDPGIIGIYTVDVTNGAVDALALLGNPNIGNYDPDWLYPGGLSVSPEGSQITIWGRLKRVASSLR